MLLRSSLILPPGRTIRLVELQLKLVLRRVPCMANRLDGLAMMANILLLLAMLLVLVLVVALNSPLKLMFLDGIMTRFPCLKPKDMELEAVRELPFPARAECILVVVWPWPLARYLTTRFMLVGVQFLQMTLLQPVVLLLLLVLCPMVWVTPLVGTEVPPVPQTVLHRDGPLLGLLLLRWVVTLTPPTSPVKSPLCPVLTVVPPRPAAVYPERFDTTSSVATNGRR